MYLFTASLFLVLARAELMFYTLDLRGEGWSHVGMSRLLFHTPSLPTAGGRKGLELSGKEACQVIPLDGLFNISFPSSNRHTITLKSL